MPQLRDAFGRGLGPANPGGSGDPLKEAYPTDASLADWAAAVLALSRKATLFADPNEAVRRAKQRALEERLLAICQPFLTDPLAVQAKLCRRIARHLSERIVFGADPTVPATNNAAERGVPFGPRHLVTSRKISGGTQSPLGSSCKMTLASLFGTWRLQHLNPFDQCCLLLQSPLR